MVVTLSGRVHAAITRCGFATHWVAGPVPISQEPDPDSDWEPEEWELQEVESTLQQQKKAIRFQKIRRQMESWSVPRLAEGFDVCTDVSRSKFVPTFEKKVKPDQKGSGNTWKLLPAGHSVSGSVLMPGREASSKDPNYSTTLKVRESNTHRTNTPRRWKGRNKGIQDLEESFVPVAAVLGHQRELQKYSSDCESTGRTGHGGLPSDQELEELKAGEKIVQRGRQFFDSNGNFLCRI
uniref:Neugrin n=1 Tax=Rhinopithecus roxellana TaxID=61622 RepID=A0A2K6Q8N9_RHIRO